MSSDLQRANDYQMREVFVEEASKPKKLKIECFDTYMTADGLVYLIYKGELVRKAEEKE
ncbi:MAG: hypothetical protein ACPGSB_08350 [Opitutales bacterium]